MITADTLAVVILAICIMALWTLFVYLLRWLIQDTVKYIAEVWREVNKENK